MEFIKWIWNNISQVKDMLWILFILIATVIAVLTYKRARYTLLQPLRTEVIKKQTELLVEIITFFSNEKNDFDLDYINIVHINTYSVLKNYGYVLDDDNKLKDMFNELAHGAIIVGRSNQLHDLEVAETFKNKSNQNDELENSRKKYGDLKKGKVDIELIHVTKKYYDTVQKLNEFCTNPFIPNVVKEPLISIISNVRYDISTALKEVLEEFIILIYEKNKTEHIVIEPSGIYNKFNRRRTSNDKLILQIRNEIRKYLLIDKKW